MRGILKLTVFSSVVLAIAFAACPAHGATENVLLTFIFNDGYSPTGAQPVTGVIADAAGNLYGTTWAPAAVYELTPNGDGSWTQTILHSFTGSPDGQGPISLIFDSQGNLYGATSYGGANGKGTLFKLTPGQSGWTETIIYNFPGGKDGQFPLGPMILDEAGNFFVVALWNIVEVSPSGSGYTSRKIYGGNEGNAVRGLTMDASGNIFSISAGMVFELTPNKKGRFTTHVLHRFVGGPDDGSGGVGNPTFDKDGNFYGTTQGGGISGNGTVFEMSPGRHGKWSESIVYSFPSVADPSSGIVFDAAGNAYGSTSDGGESGDGTIFQLTPPIQNGNYNLIWSFNGSDGAVPRPLTFRFALGPRGRSGTQLRSLP
ncbi:MAG: choice-of-anchor tandem repeat GloVer-containing protein [Terriglobales bacterium]